MKKEAIAYHEAGHVAAHLYFDHPFEYVTIIPNDECSGHVHAPASSDEAIRIINSGSPTAEDERFLKREMIILMAGDAAVRKLKGHNKYFKGVENDNRTFVRLAEAMDIYDKALTHYSRYISQEAKDLLDRGQIWNYVKTLANLLSEKNTVTYLECKEAIHKDLRWVMS
jgi:hypothetical protein